MNILELSEQEIGRRQSLQELRALGIDPYPAAEFPTNAFSTDIRASFDDDAPPREVVVAGRMMSRRVMGKASFAEIQDSKGRIQVYITRDDICPDEDKTLYNTVFKRLLDIGDFIGVEGFVFRTQTGEISIHAKSLKLLSKSLKPLPIVKYKDGVAYDKFDDPELRYRQRYVDLIMNQDVRDTFIKRSRIISSIRRYLDGLGFLEVETPMLVQNAGGAAARPFLTHFNALNQDLKLRISLELYLKRLIVGGLEKVYEIGRVFRNEGMDTRHNPEFTLMELYQAYTDFHGMMDLTENLYRHVAWEVLGTDVVTYNGVEIDLGKPFARMTMTDAVKQYSGVDFREIHTLEQARAAAKAKGVAYEERHGKGDILSLFFEEFVEEHLLQPTFITEHPVEISPLTKRKPDDPEYVERFELFINGWEMANAYSELNDPLDQRERVRAQEEMLAKGDEEANTTDEDFLNALEIGMPPTGGIGYGIDRLCMLLTDSAAIRDVLLFPTMKPLASESSENSKNPVEETEAETAPAAPAPAVNDPAMPLFDAEKPDFSKLVIEPLFQDLVDFETFSKSDFRAVKVLECEAVKKSKKLLKFVLDDGSGENRIILSGIHAYYEPEELIGKTCIAITNLPPRPMMGIESCGMLISAVHHEGEEEKLHLLMVDPSIPAGAKLY